MASRDSHIDKPLRGRPELPDVNINKGTQSINTERASLIREQHDYVKIISDHVRISQGIQNNSNNEDLLLN